jgi:photosystem II stability/assembly factor-like uncharacterized protein
MHSKPVHNFIVYTAFLFAIPAGSHNLLGFDDTANPVSRVSSAVHKTTSAFVIDPKNTSIVYAATSLGLFKSTDGGAHWSPSALTAGLNALAVDPSNRSVMYAATSGKGVFKSVDAGATWTESGLPKMEVKAVLVESGSTIFAGVFDGGLQKSVDSGTNWSDAALGEKFVNALASDTSKPSVVYAGGGGGILKSIDGGATWSKTSLAAPLVRTVSIKPRDPDTLYVGVAGGGIYRSTDGGQNWKACNPQQQIYVVNDLLATDSAVYAATGIGVLKSSDGGDNWTPANNGLPTNTDIRTIAVDPSNPSVLYVGTFGAGTFKTTNGGAKWELMESL